MPLSVVVCMHTLMYARHISTHELDSRQAIIQTIQLGIKTKEEASSLPTSGF